MAAIALRRAMLAAALLGLAAVAEGQARASLTLVTSRAALGGNDSVDWGQLGAPFTVVPNPSMITSTNGLTLTVSQATGSFQRRDEGTGWAGNFAAGDHLLWTNGNNGPVSVSIGLSGVSAAGTQIQPDSYGNYTAKIEAFDSGNNSLGSFTENGVSTANQDNAAIFIGVRSTAADIFKITFSLTVSPFNSGQDIAINRLDFDSRGVTAAPEPWTLFGGATGVLLLLGPVWRRRRRSVA